jgi:hypothetical protein
MIINNPNDLLEKIKAKPNLNLSNHLFLRHTSFLTRTTTRVKSYFFSLKKYKNIRK